MLKTLFFILAIGILHVCCTPNATQESLPKYSAIKSEWQKSISKTKHQFDSTCWDNGWLISMIDTFEERYNNIKKRANYIADSMKTDNISVHIWVDQDEVIATFNLLIYQDTSGVELSYNDPNSIYKEEVISKDRINTHIYMSNHPPKEPCIKCSCKEGVWISSNIKAGKIQDTQLGW